MKTIEKGNNEFLEHEEADFSITIDGEYQIVRKKIQFNEWNTFDEWSSRGFQINKGAKAQKINGKNFFHRSQVTKTRWKTKCERSRRISKKRFVSDANDMYGGDIDDMVDITGESCAMEFFS